MKTQEQKRQDVVSYLKKTSKHLFLKENGEFFRVKEVDGKFKILVNEIPLKDIDLDTYMRWYPQDPKQSIKRLLFSNNHKMKSIPMKALKRLQQKDEIKVS